MVAPKSSGSLAWLGQKSFPSTRGKECSFGDGKGIARGGGGIASGAEGNARGGAQRRGGFQPPPWRE